ncbi:MAG: DUF1329 domain-containing protein [Candidatus Binataceae bacterium]|nr:DUF1329 domain-containing protein [Candidatus Binataceae bacterium]
MSVIKMGRMALVCAIVVAWAGLACAAASVAELPTAAPAPVVIAQAAAPSMPAAAPPSAASASSVATLTGQTPVAGVPRMTSGPNGIPIGTKITMANWQQYQAFMPDGMVQLFQGALFWKMPPDLEIDIGPTYNYPLPKSYNDATEQYSPQVRLQRLPNGHWTLTNYVAGRPFPNPQDPDKGQKILADEWFAYGPHVSALSPETGLGSTCTSDRFGNNNCLKFSAVFRQLDYNTDPGIPRTESGAEGAWYTEWLMIEEPEESKYTADLTIFYSDMDKPEGNFVYVPSLRRSLRLASTARCAPLFSTDFTHDDERAGFNGGIATFDATFLRDQKIIALANLTTADGAFPDNYDMPLGFARPSWGAWSVRDTYVLDTRRVATASKGYCYGKRIMYVDKNFFHEQWMDLYDANMKLWKTGMVSFRVRVVPNIGVAALSSLAFQFWDLQSDHATYTFTADGAGRDIVINQAVPPQYNNIDRYSTPSGLMQINR